MEGTCHLSRVPYSMKHFTPAIPNLFSGKEPVAPDIVHTPKVLQP